MEIFKTTTEKNGTTQVKWFYKIKDPLTKQTKTRVCKGCKTQEEAIKFVSKIKLNTQDKYLVKNIAASMYIPGSKHLQRLEQFGKTISDETIEQKRQILNLIIKDFGNYSLVNLKISEIEEFLINDKNHSGSWKNFYLETFCNIYDETIWVCPSPVQRPKFQKFSRNSKKPDILSTEELNKLFNPNIWTNEQDFLILYLIASCGLRLGEARGVKVRQLDFKNNALLIDGFCKYNGLKTNYNKCGSSDNNKFRVTPMPEDLQKKLQAFIIKNNRKENDFVFSRMDNKPYRPEYVEKCLKRQLVKANIVTENRKLVPHSLRFTYVTRMRRQLNIEQVQKIVGHNSIKMTEYYTRAGLPEMLQSLQQTLPSANNLFN